MEQFFQIIAAILLSVVLVVILRNCGSGVGELLTLMVCCMVTIIALQYIKPLIQFMESIETIGGLNTPMFKNILKAVGIAVTAEITQMICEDSGNRAIGKALQYLTTGIITYLTLPMLTALLDLIEEVLSQI